MQNTSISNDLNLQLDQPEPFTQNNNLLNNHNFVISPFTNNVSQVATNTAMDYTEINRMIESNVARILQNLNLSNIPTRTNLTVPPMV